METVPEMATDATIYKYTYRANVTDDNERSKKLIDLSSDTSFFVLMVNTSRLHVQGTQTFICFLMFRFFAYSRFLTGLFHRLTRTMLKTGCLSLVSQSSWFRTSRGSLLRIKTLLHRRTSCPCGATMRKQGSIMITRPCILHPLHPNII